jgi:D-sedoheptulose 7-phosphate isomerase
MNSSGIWSLSCAADACCFTRHQLSAGEGNVARVVRREDRKLSEKGDGVTSGGESAVNVAMTQVEAILAIWKDHLDVARALPGIAADVGKAVDLIGDALLAGGQLLLVGNGGSAADAQHIAAELTGRFLRERRPLRAIALHANSSALTAVGNDYGFEHVFARELSAHARPGDVLLALSTSGNSPNILRAIDAAREHGVTVVGLTGASGGQMRGACDVCLCVPSARTPRIQEMHITIGHTICELVEERLFR